MSISPSPLIPSLDSFRRALLSPEGQKNLIEKLTLLHCTTEYPARFEDVNLRALDTLALSFGLPVGLSDHTPGISVAIAAVARGATVIEKHFTLDKNLPGPDHQASLAPAELKSMIAAIREVEAALGNGRKLPSEGEFGNALVARKSLVAARDIQPGEPFSVDNLAIRRPGTGPSPMEYWDFLGRSARRAFRAGEVLER